MPQWLHRAIEKIEAAIAAPTEQIQRASPDQYTSAVCSATGETYLSIGCSFLCCMPRIRRIRIPYPNGIDTHISSASFRNRNFQTYPISALLFQICLALRTTRCWFVLYSLFPGYHWQAVPLEKPVWLRVPTGVGTGRFTTHRNWAGLTFFPPTRDSCVGRSMYTAHTAYDWTHLFLWFLHYWFEPCLVSSVSRRSRRHIRRIPCRLTGPLTRFCFCT